jgi:transcriptional regulator with XRE-family HTH domain
MGLFRCPYKNWTSLVKTIHSEKYRYLLALLREAREKAGITQAELSVQLAKPQSYVSKYENGERRLDVIEFLGVCRALECDPHVLIKRLG